MSRLSVVVATFNEEENIVECLESVSFADELIVVDGSSSDRTVELARRFTDKVFIRLNDINMKINNRFGFEQVTGEWILLLDADERVSPELSTEIVEAIQASTGPDGYEFPRRNFIFGRWLRHGGNFPDWQTRLFRKGKGGLAGAHVHERISIDGPVSRLSGHLIHFSIPDIKDILRKIDGYSDDIARYQHEQGQSVRGAGQLAWRLLFRPAVIFLRSYVLMAGFRDGVTGLVYSIFSAYSEFLNAAKLWELDRDA